MNIVLIAAMGVHDRVIGRNGELPWEQRLSEDFRHFKRSTLGKPCIMGRKTAESIMRRMDGNLLPGRTNIVLTRGCRIYDHPQAYCAESPEEALFHAREHLNGQDEVMVIGGEQIYKLFLPKAHQLLLTIVHGNYEGDAYFPLLNEGWVVQEEKTRVYSAKDGAPSFRIETYIRA